MLPALRDASAGLAFSRLEFIDDGGRRVPPENEWERWYAKGLGDIASCPTLGCSLLLNNTSVTSSNFLFTRTLREKVGAFSAHRFCHDWDFLMRSVLVAEPVYVPEVLLQYRLHQTNSTASLRDVQEAELSDALNRYLAAAMAGAPENALAPAPSNWPDLLPRFLEERKFMFGTEVIAHYVRPELLADVRAECDRILRQEALSPEPRWSTLS
jgi:hypothetical protein